MDNIIIFCAKYLFVLTFVLLVFAWFRTDRNRKPQFVLAFLVAGVIAFILSRIGNHLYYDPRPFVTEHVEPLISHSADNGFPSDHALLTMTIAAVTYFYNKKAAAIILAIAIAVGIARVLAKVHSPLDIAGGWIIGIIGAVLGFYLVSYFWEKRQTKPQQSES